MFKKLNKLYTTVFGDEDRNYPCSLGSDESKLPLQSAVRELEYNNKRLVKVIEALLTHLNVELDDDWSKLSNEYTFTIKKKSNK